MKKLILISIISLMICISCMPITYHKQMNLAEYDGEFTPSIKEYFGDNDIRYNFCGVMSLLNVLDEMSVKKTGLPYGISAVELVNKYFVDDNGNMIRPYDNRGNPFYSNSGSMSPTSLYWILNNIGYDTKLWQTKLVYGTNDYTRKDPIKKYDLTGIVEDMNKNIFDNNGLAIINVAVADHNQFSYFHFVVVKDMRTKDGITEMLIIDSMGKDGNGYYGWVSIDDYTTSLRPDDIEYDPKIFTGIYNIYGVTLIREKNHKERING